MDFLKLTDTGLVIASRQEIYNQLCIFARAAYGNDISLDEGSPFNAYLQMLSDSLSTLNGSVQSFSELFSTKELSGSFLDFVAGRRGVVRKTKSNQKVIMTCTVDGTVIKPFTASRNTIYIKDNRDRIWVNTTQLTIQNFKFLPDGSFDTTENFQGTCEFGLLPLDGIDTDLLYANNYPSLTNLVIVSPSPTVVMSGFSFINKVNATPAIAVSENDAQLRARYDQATYSNAVATVDGLKSNLLKFVNYVRIIENLTDSASVSGDNPYGLEAHSIWVIVDGGSTAVNYEGTDETVSSDASDITIAQTILNYKSLGCGVSTSGDVVNGTIVIDEVTYKTGNFMCEFPIETIVAQIPFTRLVQNEVDFNITLHTTSSDGALRDTVREKVSYALNGYIGSLQVGEVITLSGIVSAVNTVLSQYENGLFDFVSSTTTYAIGAGILVYQRAVGGDAVVVFDDES